MAHSQKRSSSHHWLKRHFKDEYVKRAQLDGYRSRAAYKLLEIQAKDRIIHSGYSIIDLGAAPGSWSQVAANILYTNGQPNSGKIIALDILPIDPISSVHIIQGDFKESETVEQLYKELETQVVDLVLSDLAPNVTGMVALDQPRAIYLCELALDFCHNVLKPNGTFVVKVFQGSGFEEYFRNLKSAFQRVSTRKPKASRKESREIYLVARGFKN